MIETENKNVNSKNHRRRGGAFDTVARVLRGIGELVFRSGVIIRNRVGATTAEGANTESSSVFEMYHQKAPKDGKFNIMVIGSGGLVEEGTLNTNVINLIANSRTDQEVNLANGIVVAKIARDGEERPSSFGIFDTRTVADTVGVSSQITGEGEGGAQMVYLNDAGTVLEYFLVDLNGIQGTGVYQNISDERVKKDISNLSYGLEEIKLLRPVIYRKKGGVPLNIRQPDGKEISTKDGERFNLGLIAQEVKEIIPEAVFGSEEKLYSIGYETLIPVLINAVKELSAQIEEMKNEEPI